MIPAQDRDWDDLLSTGLQPDPDEVRDQVRHDLGMDSARRVRYQPDGPDIQDLREGLGL